MASPPFSLNYGVAANTAIIPAAINASSSGNNTVVAAVAGKRIVVLYVKLIVSAAITVTWESSGGTVIDGPFSLALNGGYVEPFATCGHFSTLVGEGLVLNLGSGNQVGGNLLYSLI